jgi:uncharacterized protein involved in outer membrane biogenesis
VFGALLIAPNFINWNEYRDDIVEYVYNVTGRNLEIRGNIELEVLPSPALLINGVHIANVEGAATVDTLMIKTIEVRMALIPLLGRHLKINTVKLVEPTLNIEILSDGRNNMEIGTRQASGNKSSNFEGSTHLSLKSGSLTSFLDEFKIDSLSLSIDHFYVQNGLITYRDEAKGHREKMKNLNGQFSLASSLGPIESSGSVTIRGIPITYSMTTGSIMRDRTLPLNFILKSTQADSNIRFSGALTQIHKSPRIKGKLKFNSENLAKLVHSLDDSPQLPNIFDNTVSVVTSLAASATGGVLSNIILKLGSAQGTGRIAFQQRTKTDFNMSFAVNKLDIDALLKPKALKTRLDKINLDNDTTKSIKDDISGSSNIPLANFIGSQVKSNLLPKNISAFVDISIASIIYNNDAVRQVKVNATLEDQEITISQASALLPGGTDLGLQGIIFDQVEKKLPQFEGTTDLKTNNLRALLDWIGVDLSQVPANRARNLTVGGTILANPKKLSFNKISGQIDDTKIKGALAMTLDKRILFDINISVRRVNLDRYLYGKVSKKFISNVVPNKTANLVPKTDVAVQTKSRYTSGFLSIPEKYDANLNIKIDELVFKSLLTKKIVFKGKFNNKKLAVSTFKVANVAGLSAKLAGDITFNENIPGIIDPIFNNFRFSSRGKNFTPVLAFLGLKPEFSVNKIGPINLSGTVNGKLKTLKVLANLSLLGGRFSINGLVKPYSVVSPVQVQFSMFHPSLPALVNTLGGSYYAKTREVGGISLSGVASGNSIKMGLSNLSGKVGNIKINGIAKVDLTKNITRIEADLKTSTIAIEELLPVQQVALFDKLVQKHQKFVVDSRIKQASFMDLSQRIDQRPLAVKAATQKTTVYAPWPNNTFDISFFRQFSGEIKLRSEGLRFHQYEIKDVDLVAILSKGILNLKRLTANAYDGALELDGQISTFKTVNQFKTRFKIINVNTGKFLSSLGTEGFRKGALDLTGEFKTHGTSIFKLVSGLSGKGIIYIRGLDIVSEAKKGSAMSGFANLFISLQNFSSTILGKKLNSKRINFNTSFSAENGIINFRDMTLKTGLGNGTAKGLVDLPNWRINSDGEIKLSQNILSQVLLKKPSKSLFLPFKVTGRLDDPRVKLETSEITKGGIRLPNILNKAVNKLEKRKGVKSVLENIIPKINPYQRKVDPNKAISSEDFFRGILRELTN